MAKILLLVLFLTGISHLDAQQRNLKRLQGTYDSIKAAGIRHPDIVMAQCIAETGWLRCTPCCLNYNNLFGFRNRSNGCMRFPNEGASIAYYKRWQDKRYDLWSSKFPGQDYFHFLKWVRYATGDRYNAGLKPILAWVRGNLKL